MEERGEEREWKKVLCIGPLLPLTIKKKRYYFSARMFKHVK